MGWDDFGLDSRGSLEPEGVRALEGRWVTSDDPRLLAEAGRGGRQLWHWLSEKAEEEAAGGWAAEGGWGAGRRALGPCASKGCGQRRFGIPIFVVG